MHFTNSYNHWNYLQRGCMDKWRSGDCFQYNPGCIPLDAFASINEMIHKDHIVYHAINYDMKILY